MSEDDDGDTDDDDDSGEDDSEGEKEPSSRRRLSGRIATELLWIASAGPALRCQAGVGPLKEKQRKCG